MSRKPVAVLTLAFAPNLSLVVTPLAEYMAQTIPCCWNIAFCETQEHCAATTRQPRGNCLAAVFYVEHEINVFI